MRIVSLLLVVWALSACSQLTVNMPAIPGAGDKQLPGKVIWHDLISSTPEASLSFYQALFGWEFEKIAIPTGFMRTLDYYVISLNGQVIGGMVDQNDLETDADISQWVVALSTDNIDSAVAAVEGAGGKVIASPVDLKAKGRIALVNDNRGALFALLQTKSGDPVDTGIADPGGFLWDEVWTDNVSAADSFYQKLFPFTGRARNLSDGAESESNVTATNYIVLESQGKPRAGIMAMPVDGLAPTWVTYLRVKDSASLDSIVERVEALGGKVLLPAQDRLAGGRAALIAGPSGAGIVLQTWSENK